MDSHKALNGVRARLGGVFGSGDDYAAEVRRRNLRRWAIALAAIAGIVVIAVGGYAIGASQVDDAYTAQRAGTVSGEQRGTVAGAQEAYVKAFKSARERAFGAAYDDAYVTAFRAAFERADLAVPTQVKVSGP